jgi:hypothetical protein
VNDGEERDPARCGRGLRGWRLERLELAAFSAVDNVPSALTQTFADRVRFGEVSLASQGDATVDELLRLLPVQCALRAPGAYPFLLALTAAVNAGTIFSASPTTPRSAIFMIGASASLLIAMITLEVFMPTVCCIAPEMPTAM